MEQLTKALQDLLVKIKDLASQIEESSVYERLLNKYDSLEPAQAKRLTWGLCAVLAIAAVVIYVYPLWTVGSLKSELSSYRMMQSELEGINARHKPQARKTFTPPAGWQNLPANTQDEFLTSVDQYLAQIGVIPELTEIKTEGVETRIRMKELTVKQAVSLLFQLEGWYPGVKITNTQINVHPESKELLQMNVAFRYDGAAASAVGGAPSGSFGDDFGGGMDLPPPENTPPPPPPSAGIGSPPNSNQFDTFPGGDEFDIPPPPPPPVLDDFGQDMPPPMEDDL